MALVKTGQGVAAISGKIGGTIFSHNKGGVYMKNFAVPTNPGTARQSTVRGNFGALAQRWSQTLTAAQRAAWETYAANVPVINRLGESINLSGISMYIRSNTLVLLAGGTEVDDGPTIFTSAAFDPTFTPTVSEATQQISVAFSVAFDWVSEDDAYMIIDMSLPANAAVNSDSQPYRFAGFIAGDSGTPPTSPQVISVPFPVAEGQIVSCRSRIVRADGRIQSVPFRVVATVAA